MWLAAVAQCSLQDIQSLELVRCGTGSATKYWKPPSQTVVYLSVKDAGARRRLICGADNERTSSYCREDCL